MEHDNVISYYNGHYMPVKDVHISPYDRGFLFADGAYEVIRVYSGTLFMANEHLTRLENSLAELRIKFGDTMNLLDIMKTLIEVNGFLDKNATIYIQITRGVYYKRMLRFPPEDIPPTIFINIASLDIDDKSANQGVMAVTLQDTRWKRCDIKSVSLLANVLAHQAAIEKNATIGIFVNEGIITEGTHTGVFGVIGNKLITHPIGQEILPSITRKIVLDLCRQLSVEVIVQPIKYAELELLDELFIVGTTPEITPVIIVDNKLISDGIPGKLTRKLQFAFAELVEMGKQNLCDNV